MAYEVIALFPSGLVRLISFIRDLDGEAYDEEGARLFNLAPDLFQRFSEELRRIDFRTIELPPNSSTMAEFIIETTLDGETHAVEWDFGGIGSLPPDLRDVVCALRGALVGEFSSAFGC